MGKPDLIILKAGHPLAVVEAKARPITSSFEEPVLQQLKSYTAAAATPWAILMDPQETRIFRTEDLRHPHVTISTGLILDATETHPAVVGQRVLIDACDRWIRILPHRQEMLDRYPQLAEFAHEVTDGVTSTEEWAPPVSSESRNQ